MKGLRYLKGAVPVILLALALGCGQGGAPSKESTPVVKKIAKKAKPTPAKKPGGKAAPKAVAHKEAGKGAAAAEASPTVPFKEVAYVYDPGDRPDPFRPFFLEEAATEEVPEECLRVPPGPLTERDSTQFALVAILRRGGQVVAMVEDSEGKGYILRVGTYIGKNCGRVSRIGLEEVIIEEPYLDLLGKRRIREVTLQFSRAKGGGL